MKFRYRRRKALMLEVPVYLSTYSYQYLEHLAASAKTGISGAGRDFSGSRLFVHGACHQINPPRPSIFNLPKLNPTCPPKTQAQCFHVGYVHWENSSNRHTIVFILHGV